MTAHGSKRLILASSSVYRRELLQRLGLPFECMSPNVDETPLANEAPKALAQRLAKAKALAVAQREPDAIIIASDQVACRDGVLLGKPGSLAHTKAQLLASSGKTVTFFTSLCVQHKSRSIEQLVTTEAKFRTLASNDVANYVAKEPAPDCAGGFKAEGLGISLFEYLRSEDPTALIGLPLIAVSAALRELGITT